MPRERVGYRDIISACATSFPGKNLLTPPQVAAVLGIDVRTVRAAMSRRRNPLPCVSVSDTRYKVPVQTLAYWVSHDGFGG